ncbi:sulfatase-like hydrolase/transferase [Paenibacillus arenilitoris]|uniref:Sulfatase-like hydrolase/transferase n=1 Tax=Paenibacillus arenilitoris TaxID=2772299 RepID=A0A927H6R6_9BACL|nr:sulfatase-like hydrolase/transferase [Paenibacillus arenilitoris]MBD2870275.1 sulfatase-like hydrolase/transferase [Paenibacillus arenilitoris]
MSNPNILVICSDQHHPLMTGYRGHPHVKTPNLDALASEGTCFTRAYCNSPVCTPSRMSFITGKYTHQIDSWFIGCPLDPEESTWARRLHEAGIPSTMLGKMDFCGDYQDGGFTEHRIIERRAAFQPYPRGTPMDSRLNGYIRPDKRKHLEHAGIRENIVTDGHHGHDDRFGFYDHDRIVTGWAVDYLKRKGQKAERKPWALYVGLLYPHWPFTVPEKYFNLYDPDNLDMPHDASFPNDRLHPQLKHFQNALDLGDVSEETMRKTIAAYYGMITAMDDMIGRIVAELKAQGLYDDTYIVYMSDHGESLGEHGLFYKQCSYEGSVGVPLIVKGPGLPAGRRIDHPVTLVDLYPTVMEMAGLATEADRPGRSWLPLIQGREHERPDYAFSEYHGNFLKQSWYMLTDGDYKYTYYVFDRPSLFHVKEDPLEMNDLAGDARYASVLERFERRLRDIVDPEAADLRSKKDLGLIGKDGTDYTLTMSVTELERRIKLGEFPNEPGFPVWR